MPERATLTPNCPLCGEPPVMVISGTQAFCGNEDTCNLLCWDLSVSREENLRDEPRRSQSMADAGFCRAISQHGHPVTVYIAGRTVFGVARPGRDFVCTQDIRHEGSHAACDGNGHILARWPRSDVERYWQRGDCESHGHAV